MTAHEFHQMVLDTLQGQTDQLQSIPPERLDWPGPGALLELFRKTSGTDRSALIEAMGQVIQEQAAPPPVLAQVIQIASSLDLAQIEPQVRKLRAKAIAAEEPLRSAITNYLAFRELNTSPKAVTHPQTSNGKPSTRKTRPARRAKGKMEKA